MQINNQYVCLVLFKCFLSHLSYSFFQSSMFDLRFNDYSWNAVRLSHSKNCLWSTNSFSFLDLKEKGGFRHIVATIALKWLTILCVLKQAPVMKLPSQTASGGEFSWRHRGTQSVFISFVPLENNLLLFFFQQLPYRFNVPEEHFHGYLQTRHFISSRVTALPIRVLYVEERFIFEHQNGSRFISLFSSLLCHINMYELPNISSKIFPLYIKCHSELRGIFKGEN